MDIVQILFLFSLPKSMLNNFGTEKKKNSRNEKKINVNINCRRMPGDSYGYFYFVKEIKSYFF